MGTFNGLAIPLHGGFVCKTSETTPIDWLTVTDIGAFKFLNYQVGANNYGVDIRSHMTDAGGQVGGQCLKAYFYHDSGVLGSGQAYTAFFQFVGAANLTCVNARIAVLDLYMNLDATYSVAGGAADCSYINFVEGAHPVPALFVITSTGGVVADESGGNFVTASNATIDHALRIYIENVAYYIGLYDSKTGS